MIKVLLADDHAIVRRGLIAVLNAEADLEVVGDAATPQEAVLLARSTSPDVVLLDVQFGVGQERGTDVVPALRAVASSLPSSC